MNRFWMLGITSLAFAGGPVQAKDLTSIGITVPSFANPYFASVVAGAEAQARAINPHVKIESESPEYDLNKQASIFDSFIGNGVNVIIIAATDAVADSPLVKRAEAAGIVVVAADSPVPGVQAAVQTDNVQLGIDVCDDLANKIGGKGDIVILNGPSVAPILARVQGCKQALAAHPDIKIVSDNQNGRATRAGGLDVMESLLTRFGHIDAVFAINDQEAIGASLAAHQLNRTDPVFFGVDGSPDIVTEIKDPSTRILATGAQDPYAIAQRAVVLANEILNGRPPAKTLIKLKPVLVTQTNADSYKGWTK
jgi:ribose transport system substrate-binding protein